MRRIRFVKEVEVYAEVPDEYFRNSDGKLNPNELVQWVDRSGCECIDIGDDMDFEQWQDGSSIKEIQVFDKDGKIEESFNEKEVNEILDDIEKADRCYECTGYGDDYDAEGNSNCETCPFKE